MSAHPTQSDTIELLTVDFETDRAIEGPKFPRHLGVVRYIDDEGDRDRIAYPHKFFKRDEHGRPMPETLVEFLVLEWMCRNGFPDRMALRLVEQRMGWDRG